MVIWRVKITTTALDSCRLSVAAVRPSTRPQRFELLRHCLELAGRGCRCLGKEQKSAVPKVGSSSNSFYVLPYISMTNVSSCNNDRSTYNRKVTLSSSSFYVLLYTSLHRRFLVTPIVAYPNEKVTLSSSNFYVLLYTLLHRRFLVTPIVTYPNEKVTSNSNNLYVSLYTSLRRRSLVTYQILEVVRVDREIVELDKVLRIGEFAIDPALRRSQCPHARVRVVLSVTRTHIAFVSVGGTKCAAARTCGANTPSWSQTDEHGTTLKHSVCNATAFCD